MKCSCSPVRLAYQRFKPHSPPASTRRVAPEYLRLLSLAAIQPAVPSTDDVEEVEKPSTSGFNIASVKIETPFICDSAAALENVDHPLLKKIKAEKTDEEHRSTVATQVEERISGMFYDRARFLCTEDTIFDNNDVDPDNF